MNYRVCQGLLMFSEIADAFYFKEESQQSIVTSINEHNTVVYFRRGQSNKFLASSYILLNEQVLTEGKYWTHDDEVYWNGARLFNKTDKPWVSLYVFITKGIIEKPIIREWDTNTVIILPNTDVDAFKQIASQSENFLFDFGSDFHVSNLINLMTQGEKRLNLTNIEPYQEADFAVTALDYLEAFRRYIEFKFPEFKVVHKDSDEQVEEHHRIITIGLQNPITHRDEFPTHVLHDDGGQLFAYMRVGANIELEFLSDDITYAQQFEHDYNADLGIRTIQEFTIKDEYGVYEDKQPEVLSPNGWSANVVWKDFVEFDTEARTQAKTFSGSTMYTIPFTCTLNFFIVKGQTELPSILRYALDTRIKNEGDLDE